MAKRKYFLAKIHIDALIQKYGGGHRWTFCEDKSDYSSIVFMDAIEYSLTINLMYDAAGNPLQYVYINIASNDGTVIRVDKYRYPTADESPFKFISTEENGCIYNEFRPINKPSAAAKRSMRSRTQKLEQQLADTQKLLEFSENRIRMLFEQAEHGFLNSPTYQQMQQELDFYKSLNKLNDIRLANANKQVQSTAEHLQQVYEDNSRLCKLDGDADYWIGITERRSDAKDHEKLRDEIRTLKGSIDQKEQAIADRDAEINRLQLLVGEIQCKLRSASTPSGCKEYEELENLRTENDAFKERIVSLEEQLTLLSATKQENTTTISERIIERLDENKTRKKLGRPFVVDKQKIDLVIALRTKG